MCKYQIGVANFVTAFRRGVSEGERGKEYLFSGVFGIFTEYGVFWKFLIYVPNDANWAIRDLKIVASASCPRLACVYFFRKAHELCQRTM